MSHPSERSPFAVAGAALVARGYSALPIAPGNKVPGRYEAGEWRMMNGWSKFCGARPPAFQVRSWESWPNAGVGVACGGGLVLVDIDLDDAVDAVVKALPPTPVAKRGAKGLTLCFRGDTSKIKSRALKTTDKMGLCDLLSDGKQSVLPPSIHPKTGLPYVWTTERTLLDTAITELPELPDNVADLIGEALKPFGYAAKPERASFEWNGEIHDSRSQSTDFFRRLNEDALANLDAWVPKLNLYRAVRNQSGWRAVPHWRPSSSGTPTNKRKLNLSFDPKGIVDFGDGSKTYTPLNVVMAALGMGSDIDLAAKFLGEWIGYSFAPAITLVAGFNAPSKRREREAAAEAAKPAPPVERPPTAPAADPEPAQVISLPSREDRPRGNIAAALAGFGPELPEALEPEERLGELPTLAQDAMQSRKLERFRRLNELTHLPGLVGDLVDWMEATSNKPSRLLSLGAALAAVGVIGGRFYETPTKLRTNLYVVNIAGSGYGKDHARKCLKHLFHVAGMSKHFGGSKVVSGSALRKQMEHQSSTLYLLDEYGGLVRDLSAKNVSPSLVQIRDYMLEYYSTASSSFGGADYAGEKGIVQWNPNLNVYGTSTQRDFWKNVSSSFVEDGFLARHIVLPVEGPRPREIDPRAEMEDIPPRIIDAFHRIMEQRGGGGNLTGIAEGPVPTLRIQCSAATKARRLALTHEVEDAEAEAPPEFSSLYGRIAENGQKIACAVAIGVNPEAPVLTTELLEWGFEVSWLSVEGMIDEIEGRLADSDYQRHYLDVKQYIEQASPTGLTRAALTKKVNGRFDMRTLEAILTNLDVSAEVTVKTTQGPRGGPTEMRYVFVGDPVRIRKKRA